MDTRYASGQVLSMASSAAKRTALVTGSTDGIGVPTAIGLAYRGFEVIVHGRSEERIAAARAQIERDVPGARTHAARADFASLAEVREMAGALARRHPAIHALVLNAGVYSPSPEKSRDGFELTFAVNHLAHFALTKWTIDLVRQGAREGHGRVVTVASIAHRSGVLDWRSIEDGGHATAYQAYAESKLLNVLFARELARRETEAKTGVTSNSLHPGVIATKLLRIGFGRGGAPVREGARTSIFCATDPSLTEITGRYFIGDRHGETHPAVGDRSACRRAWTASEGLLARAGFA